MAEALDAENWSASDGHLNVRVGVERGEVERQPGSYDFRALDARIAQYGRRQGVSLYIDLLDAEDPSSDDLDAWGRYVRAISSRYRDVVRGYVFGVRRTASVTDDPRRNAFFVKTTAINVRAGDGGAATVMGGLGDADANWLAAVYREDVAPYVDVIGLDAGSTDGAIFAVVAQFDAGSGVVMLGEPLGRDPSAGVRLLLDRHLGTLGGRVSGVTYKATAAVVAAALSPIKALRGVLGQELVSLDEGALGLRLTMAGEEVTTRVDHRLLFGLESLTNYFLYNAPTGPLELTLNELSGVRPTVEDPLLGRHLSLLSFSYDSATHTAHLGLPAQPRTLIVNWRGEDSARYSERAGVSSPLLPTAAEIVSRHQQAQAIQDGLIRSYFAQASLALHFRPNSVDAGFDVMTESRLFVEGKSTEWEERSFRLNGTKWGPRRPAFPLLQAEKVLSLPFDLRLSSDYRYRLIGIESVEGKPCFALRIEPVDEDRTLYRGTVWLDRETYLKVKTQTTQTRLSSPLVSSEEIQYFSSAGSVAGHDVQLLSRLVGRQIMLIAGRNLLVERAVSFSMFDLNPVEFRMQREAARAGDNVMYRETDDGLRNLVKRDGERVVQAPTTTATAALAGITYDPAYDYPLPLVGINYLNFNFLGKDNQLAAVFGGVLALVSLQQQHLAGERIDGGLDLFAIAVKGSDRTYDGHGELTGQRLTTRPFSVGGNLGWRVNEFQKLVVNYQFRFDAFSTDESTTAGFQPPLSTATNGLGLSWEWKRRGFSALAGGTVYRRVRWESWGEKGDHRSTDQTYAKYSASLSKDYFSGFQKVHLNAAYYGGRHLDRFSAYQFGLFDEGRIHGVPSAGVRFGELGMLRGAYSFNVFDQYHLDLSLDQAFGRDPRQNSRWQSVTGLGIGGNIRGPMSTLLRGDIGISVLPLQYRRPGSLVVQFQVLKPL